METDIFGWLRFILSKVNVSWEAIHKIGGSRAVSLAGFFPFVGYLVLTNENVFFLFNDIVQEFVSNELVLDTPFDRLKEIYFALLFLSVGVISLRLFMPKHVGMYLDRHKFADREEQSAEPYRICRFLDQIRLKPIFQFFAPLDISNRIKGVLNDKEKIRNAIEDTTVISWLGGEDEEKPKEWSTWKNENRYVLIQPLGTFYDMQNYSLPVVRLFVLLMFVVGYLKLALPSLKIMMLLIFSNS